VSDEVIDSPKGATERPSFEFEAEQLEAFRGTGYELIPLHAPDAKDERGRSIGKAPGRGWRTRAPLGLDEAKQALSEERNVGVRLRPTDLVVDVDPRNFKEGDDPVERLQRDLGIRLDDWPHVVTGSGGSHFYMTKPEDFPVLDSIDDYRGVEFKAHGRQVVAPGSSHPEARRAYRWDELAEPVASTRAAPEGLLELIRRPVSAPGAEAGEYSAEQVESLLAGLDPKAYRDQTRWLELMMACHHASGGDAREEFIAWSTSDPEYAGDEWIIGRRWDSLHAHGTGRRVTVKTLFKALIGVGRGDLVNRVTAPGDFPDEPAHSPSDEIDPVRAKRQANAAKARQAKIEKGRLRKLKAAESREQYAQWLNRTFAYDRSTGKRVNVETGEAFDDNVFENEHGPGWARSGGKGSLVNAIKTGKAGIDMPSVMMAASFPGKPRMVPIKMGTHEDAALNTWYDTTLEPVRGDHAWFRREIERLFPGDERQQEILLDYWAARCLDPGRKIRWQLVIESAQGVGKGQMKAGFNTLFGWRNCGTFGVTQMLDKFNGWMVSAANLFGEEIGFGTWKDAKEAYENMKAPITDDYIAVRPMQRESQIRVPNGTNYIVHRNPGRKFYCPDDDRRICYLQPAPDDLDEKGAHNQELARHYGSEADMAAVRWWLVNEWAPSRVAFEEDMERIAGVGHVRFDDDPPMTDAKQALIRECLKADNQDVLNFGELERLVAGLDLFTADDVVRLARENRLDQWEASDDQLLLAARKWLNASGYKKTRNTNGQGITLYSPAGDARLSALGPADREREYLERP
jgi:hypothetical protein